MEVHYGIRRLQLETCVRRHKGQAENRKGNRHTYNQSGPKAQSAEYAMESTL